MVISSWMVMYWMSYVNACNTHKHTCSMHIQISSSLIGCAKWWSVMDHVEGCMCQGIMDNRWASCLYGSSCLLKLYAEWPFEATNPTYDNSHPHISNTDLPLDWNIQYLYVHLITVIAISIWWEVSLWSKFYLGTDPITWEVFHPTIWIQESVPLRVGGDLMIHPCYGV